MQTGLTNTPPTNAVTFPVEGPAKKQYVITRRLNVNITSSLTEMSKNKGCSTWTPLNGRVSRVFGVNSIFQGEAADDGTSAHMLQNAILHKVTVLEQKNEFPVNVGITIGCIPNDEVTCNGDQFAVTSFANSHNTTECTVFCADTDSTESAQWRSEYPLYNSSNLETQGVLQVNNQQYVFVHQDHPVIQVLRINRDLINADIDKQQKIDNEWFKVMRTVMNTCCAELRQRVLNKVSARDLNTFSVNLQLLGKVGGWTEEDNNNIYRSLPHDVLVRQDQNEIQQHINVLLSRRYSYSARLEVLYEVHA